MLPYSPLHHLLLADVGDDARDDERQRVRRADRLPRRRRARAPARDRRPVPRPRPADRDAHRRLGRARWSRSTAATRAPAPLARLRPGDRRPPRRRHAAPAARLRRRAQEHVLPGSSGTRAWVSHHIGDLENYETLRSFPEGIDHFERAVRGRARGRRPRPASRVPLDQVRARAGRGRADRRPAPPRASGGVPGRARRVDRARRSGRSSTAPGYGLDGTVWGGELLLGDLRVVRARRVAAARSRCPAGRARSGSRGGWRAPGCRRRRRVRAAAPGLARPARSSPGAWAQVHRLAATGTAAPATTSMGRLFDAVAALAGIRAEVNYEGQAAIELEAACDHGERGSYPIVAERRTPGDRPPRDDPRGGRRRRAGERAGRDRAAASTARSRAPPSRPASSLAGSHGTGRRRRCPAACSRAACCSSRCRTRADGAGLRVLVPERLPVNDGGIAYGQAAVAAASL